jgi:hypothetical protein
MTVIKKIEFQIKMPPQNRSAEFTQPATAPSCGSALRHPLSLPEKSAKSPGRAGARPIAYEKT